MADKCDPTRTFDFGPSTETPLPLETLFVGREAELQALYTHFAQKGRLAQIVGIRGTGKTSLMRMFCRRAEEIFPGGVNYLDAFPPQTLRDLILEAIRPPIKKNTLVVVDDIDIIGKSEISEIPQLLHEHQLLNVLLVGQIQVDIPDFSMLSISLGGLSAASFQELIKRRLHPAIGDIDLINDLYHRSQGNPMLAAAAGQSVRDGLVNLRQFSLALRDFDYQAIVRPDGKPYSKGLVVPKKVVVAVTAVNLELLIKLKENPALLRSLSPRKFEEVVAELLKRQGFIVELTPASRDGGFDMYAAKSEAIGQFLYLVECKRYSPPKKVGVQVVRELNCVLRETRATAGVIATTSFFTDSAKEYQQQFKYQLQLRDYIELQKWLGLIR
jgi:restriction system protein